MKETSFDRIFNLDHPVVWQYKRMISQGQIEAEEAAMKITEFFFDQNQQFYDEIVQLRKFMTNPVLCTSPGEFYSSKPPRNPFWLSDLIGKIVIGMILCIFGFSLGYALGEIFQWMYK